MNSNSFSGATRALTLIEVLVVMVVVAVMVVVLIPARFNDRARAQRVQCMSNLRQIGIELLIWASDHTNDFPWLVSENKGGTLELSDSGKVSPHFRVLSKEVRDWRMFRCPTDSRPAATNVEEFDDRNISYFINLSASPSSPDFILSGDRNLQIDGQPVKPGRVLLTSSSPRDIGWTSELHPKVAGGPGGDLLFSDGHVEWNFKALAAQFQRGGLRTNQLAIP